MEALEVLPGPGVKLDMRIKDIKENRLVVIAYRLIRIELVEHTDLALRRSAA